MRLAGVGPTYSGEDWLALTYDAVGDSLYRYALVIVADTALAEDVVQQAFICLLKRGHFHELASAHGYLRTVVRHECYRLLAGKRTMEGLGHVTDQLLQPVDNFLECAEERQQLEGALRQPTADQREVIHLKVYERQTFAEIGMLLGISLNTAASRYRYAIGRLREILSVARS